MRPRVFRSFRAFVYLTVALAVPSTDPAAAQGQWVRKEYVDAITDDSVRTTTTAAAGGYELTIYRIAGGRVWGRFSIPDQNLDVLSPEKLLIYRIDDHEPQDLGQDLSIQRFLDVPLIQAEPKWVNT